MHEVILSRWGNSLALRVPKFVAEAFSWSAGSKVVVTLVDDGIIIRRAPKSARKRKLQDLLEQIDDQNIHEEADWGAAQGKELV